MYMYHDDTSLSESEYPTDAREDEHLTPLRQCSSSDSERPRVSMSWASAFASRTLALLASFFGVSRATAIELSSGGYTCDNVLTAPYGHVESENGVYHSGYKACWLIQPAGRRTVTLSFKSFETERDFDTLRVFDGSTTGSLPLGVPTGYSGKTVPPSLTSTGPSMLLIFDSDYSVVGNGFTFAWTSTGAMPLPTDMCAADCLIASIGDGVCKDACFNEQCMWDQEATRQQDDCSQSCNATSGCLASEQADGTCDTRCFNAGCNFDREDCVCKNVVHAPCTPPLVVPSESGRCRASLSRPLGKRPVL